MTIVFFTSLFTSKALEYNYTQKQLTVFGVGTALATLIFMVGSVIVITLISAAIPILLIQILNGIVGVLIVGYGIQRLIKAIRSK